MKHYILSYTYLLVANLNICIHNKWDVKVLGSLLTEFSSRYK